MASNKAALVSLTTNPCKMCMPMGAVTAFYGIKKCICLLHGSQGCSTYIRRHMATHYNEPVDIASSSLTEQGTVYGGEDNLLTGLKNLISVYDPEVIAVATTCLAETIGEDVARIIEKFNASYTGKKITIIPAASGGFAGTQFEGFFHALYSIVSNIPMLTQKHDDVNIITGPISPADTRALKSLLDQSGLSYILLPDISENLDGGHEKVYQKLPSGGTSIYDVSRMAGSRMTIELSEFAPDRLSPGLYLEKTYGVPLTRLPLPIGLRDTDAFMNALRLAGASFPSSVEKDRGRHLDAMIDAHKYNAKARAVIFGEPDFVYSMSRLCLESGIFPSVAASGAACPSLTEKLRDEIQSLSDRFLGAPFRILDQADFDEIEEACVQTGANILIGSSDGRRISERRNLPLIRCAFPIHDALGGQRIRLLFYDGALSMINEVANHMLHHTETTFRQELYEKYYPPTQMEDLPVNHEATLSKPMTIEEKTATHPCYNCGAGKYARIHLPIAPKCNISCNYCVRKFDCPNESRPGVTTKVITPEEAVERYLSTKAKMPNLKVVGIAGPGEALANFENTKKTLEQIRAIDPDVTFCLSTNGLMLPFYAQQLIDLGVSHITVTMNAVDPEIGAKIYRYVDYLGKRYIGVEAAKILQNNQLSGLSYLTAQGIICKVNVVMLKGVNDHHVEEVVKTVSEMGIHITNIMQMIPVQGSVFERLPLVSNRELDAMRNQCSGYIKQMFHCRQCRADAVGTLDKDESGTLFPPCPSTLSKEEALVTSAEKEAIKPITSGETESYRAAVCTKSGILVDQHFGQASELHIYECRGKEVSFVEKRKVDAYCSGSTSCGDNKETVIYEKMFETAPDEKEGKIEKLLTATKDCDYVIAMRIGDAPSRRLLAQGTKPVTTYEPIEKAVSRAESLYHLQKRKEEDVV